MKQNNFSLNKINSNCILLLIGLIVASNFLKRIYMLRFLTYTDELLMIYIFFILVYSFLTLKINKYLFFIYSSLVYMIGISIYSHNASIDKIIIQSFIHMKFFIFYFILDKYLNVRQLEKIFLYLFIFTLVGITLNILMQETFNEFTGLSIDYRNGLLRVGGFQVTPNFLGLTLGLYYLYFLLGKPLKIKKMVLITFLFGFLIFLTGSRISLVIIIVGIFFFFLSKDTKYQIYMIPFVVLLLIIFVAVILNTEILDKTLNNFTMMGDGGDSPYIRGIMFYFGYQLFIDNFPIGTGSATFGSVLSQGSVIYDSLGLSNRSFFIDMQGVFDSNVATIMGEFGLIGICIFLFLLSRIYKSAYNTSNRFYLLSIFTVLMITMITNPIFMNGYASMLFTIFLVYTKKNTILK